ncbi:MAG TPA: glycogen synthase [Candidatus Omnitrophota bacterium]|nr:glycogen synthase [Candidatus Omnitrophota bacterium]
MKVLLLTNEYPPNTYGGAGVHVSYLSRELSKLCNVNVRCFGEQRLSEKMLSVMGFTPNHKDASSPKHLHRVFSALQCCLDFNAENIDSSIVHAHTWYTHFGGILAKLTYSIPFVLTVHSLEPLRPWKFEQLGGGYDFSCWVEKTAIEMADAVIAVSEETRRDVVRIFNVNERKVHAIHNGIDLNEYQPTRAPEKLLPIGIDPRKPYVLFVGRITKQKGIFHLLNAIRHLDSDVQIVIYASAADTEEIAQEMKTRIARIKRERGGIFWIDRKVDLATKVALYSHATVFCCPSIYEPFGIINLEAMACECPVVATAVGGIREVVRNGETGFLVPIEQGTAGSFEPVDPEKFSADLAEKINVLLENPTLRARMGTAGRQRTIDCFSWTSIAKKTHQLYQNLLSATQHNRVLSALAV